MSMPKPNPLPPTAFAERETRKPVTFRVSDAERELMEARAKRDKIDLAELVRRSVRMYLESQTK